MDGNMNLLAGLEKFGLKAEDTSSLFEDEKKKVVSEDGTVKEEAPTEDSFLLDKAIRCAVCDKVFKTKLVKNGRLKRLEADFDMRPRFEYIDTNKYGVASCPYCGYTALDRYFDHLTSAQIKLIKEGVCANFKGDGDVEPKILDYDAALERYKLALFCTITKKGKTSEKAYICLKTAWLLRGKAENVDPKDPNAEKIKQECKAQEEAFYAQAYEGFTKAVSSENFPICGMDATTMDYLMAVMSAHYKKYDVASKCIARIMQAPAASKRMKELTLDLKERIVGELQKNGK